MKVKSCQQWVAKIMYPYLISEANKPVDSYFVTSGNKTRIGVSWHSHIITWENLVSGHEEARGALACHLPLPQFRKQKFCRQKLGILIGQSCRR